MSDVRRCLGCGNTYPPDEHACPKCGSHAADTEVQAEPKPEPKRQPRRKT
jgi:rRNA maturation endonuclease Nob1